MTAKKASERILSGTIQVGDSVIQLVAETHKAILSALFNLTTSTVGNTDALASAEVISEFISDIKVADLVNYTFTIEDEVKRVSFNGANLAQLTKVWGLVEVDWLVTRGGKREVESKPIVKLSQLAK
jgi:hypothetical protein